MKQLLCLIFCLYCLFLGHLLKAEEQEIASNSENLDSQKEDFKQPSDYQDENLSLSDINTEGLIASSIELTDSNFNFIVDNGKQNKWFVYFYAPDQQRSQDILPKIVDFSKDIMFNEQGIKIGIMNCLENQLTFDILNIVQFPAIKMFYNNSMYSYPQRQVMEKFYFHQFVFDDFYDLPPEKIPYPYPIYFALFISVFTSIFDVLCALPTAFSMYPVETIILVLIVFVFFYIVYLILRSIVRRIYRKIKRKYFIKNKIKKRKVRSNKKGDKNSSDNKTTTLQNKNENEKLEQTKKNSENQGKSSQKNQEAQNLETKKNQ